MATVVRDYLLELLGGAKVFKNRPLPSAAKTVTALPEDFPTGHSNQLASTSTSRWPKPPLSRRTRLRRSIVKRKL